MGTRRKAREMAMQALFFMDARQDFSPASFERFCANFSPKPDERPFFLRLVEGVLSCREQLDPLIERFSENWSLSRMSGVDRNIMRIAVYELLCCRDIPAKVSINEAVDIGKKFGTEESGAFINGIVDSIRAAAEAGEVAFPCREAAGGGRLAFAVEAAPAEPAEPPPPPAAARPRRARKRASPAAVLRRKRRQDPVAEEK
jgi:N utilization substance protein B